MKVTIPSVSDSEFRFKYVVRKCLPGGSPLVDSGNLAVDIARQVRLNDLATAHRQADEGQVHGKVVVVPPAA